MALRLNGSPRHFNTKFPELQLTEPSKIYLKVYFNEDNLWTEEEKYKR